MDVAIKRLHTQDATHTASLEREAAMHQLLGEHAHIVQLVGMCVHPDPAALITRYCMYGSLERLLVR